MSSTAAAMSMYGRDSSSGYSEDEFDDEGSEDEAAFVARMGRDAASAATAPLASKQITQRDDEEEQLDRAARKIQRNIRMYQARQRESARKAVAEDAEREAAAQTIQAYFRKHLQPIAEKKKKKKMHDQHHKKKHEEENKTADAKINSPLPPTSSTSSSPSPSSLPSSFFTKSKLSRARRMRISSSSNSSPVPLALAVQPSSPSGSRRTSGLYSPRINRRASMETKSLIEKQTARIEKLEQRLISRTASMKSFTCKNNELSDQLASETDQHAQDNASNGRRIKELSDSNTSLQDSCTQLKVELEKALLQIESQNQIRELALDKQRVADKALLAKEMARHEETRKDLVDTRDSHATRVDLLNSMIRSLEQTGAEQADKVNTLKTDVVAHKETAEGLRDTISDLSALLHDAKKEIAELKEVRERLATRTAEMEDFKRRWELGIQCITHVRESRDAYDLVLRRSCMATFVQRATTKLAVRKLKTKLLNILIHLQERLKRLSTRETMGEKDLLLRAAREELAAHLENRAYDADHAYEVQPQRRSENKALSTNQVHHIANSARLASKAFVEKSPKSLVRSLDSLLKRIQAATKAFHPLLLHWRSESKTYQKYSAESKTQLYLSLADVRELKQKIAKLTRERIHAKSALKSFQEQVVYVQLATPQQYAEVVDHDQQAAQRSAFNNNSSSSSSRGDGRERGRGRASRPSSSKGARGFSTTRRLEYHPSSLDLESDWVSHQSSSSSLRRPSTAQTGSELPRHAVVVRSSMGMDKAIQEKSNFLFRLDQEIGKKQRLLAAQNVFISPRAAMFGNGGAGGSGAFSSVDLQQQQQQQERPRKAQEDLIAAQLREQKSKENEDDDAASVVSSDADDGGDLPIFVLATGEGESKLNLTGERKCPREAYGINANQHQRSSDADKGRPPLAQVLQDNAAAERSISKHLQQRFNRTTKLRNLLNIAEPTSAYRSMSRPSTPRAAAMGDGKPRPGKQRPASARGNVYDAASSDVDDLDLGAILNPRAAKTAR